MSRRAGFSRRATSVALLTFLTGCAHHESQSLLHKVREANETTQLTLALDSKPKVPADNQPFLIHSREATLATFPCQRCHKLPLAQMKHDGKDGKPKAHWNLKLRHATDAVMNCATCHDAANLNQLKSLTNKPISLNQSAQLCAQCHSKQATDWAGGAHGKRLAGWAPPRLSKTCVECHNPHQPQWDKRAPVHVSLTGLAKKP